MEPDATAALPRQIDFLLAADALKRVERHNGLLDGSRRENAAEHSWHLALMALTLAGHAPAGTDRARVSDMLLVHDLVEIHAGDHWAGDCDPDEVAAMEEAAAIRLFGLLDPEQAGRIEALWREFEARVTPEARFARALDALHPMLLVWGPGGTDLAHTPVTASFMRALKRPALEAFPALWALAERLLDGAVARGVLPP